jgi:hypothetical protein
MPKTAVLIHLSDQDEQTLRRWPRPRAVQHPDRPATRYIQAWNADCHPFAWVKDADQILVKAACARRRMS